MESKVGFGSTFTFNVTADLFPGARTAEDKLAETTGSKIVRSKTTNDELENGMISDFSMVTNRMHMVFQQFKQGDAKKKQNVELAMIQPIFGPASKSINSSPKNQRILVVDDQIFNIEFLRCHLELIPSVRGRCDYVEGGLSAVKLVKESL